MAVRFGKEALPFVAAGCLVRDAHGEGWGRSP